MKKTKNEIKEDNEIREYFILMARTIERDRLLDVMRVKQGAKDKEIIMCCQYWSSKLFFIL